jgi:hypothetical protein
MKKIILWICAIVIGIPVLLAVIGIAASPDHIEAPATADSKPIQQKLSAAKLEVKPTLTAKERKQLLDAATKGLKVTRDKIEKISFYQTQSGYKSQLGTYFAISDDSKEPYLRVRAQYYGDNWVFFDTIKIMADDEVIYEKAFRRSEIERDNSAGSVWEVADFLAAPGDMAMLKKVSKSKSATIRFSGGHKQYDHNISKSEAANLATTLKGFENAQRALSP